MNQYIVEVYSYLKLGKAVYFRSTFCYIFWNSLYIPAAIKKSIALTKKKKEEKNTVSVAYVVGV